VCVCVLCRVHYNARNSSAASMLASPSGQHRSIFAGATKCGEVAYVDSAAGVVIH